MALVPVAWFPARRAIKAAVADRAAPVQGLAAGAAEIYLAKAAQAHRAVRAALVALVVAEDPAVAAVEEEHLEAAGDWAVKQ